MILSHNTIVTHGFRSGFRYYIGSLLLRFSAWILGREIIIGLSETTEPLNIVVDKSRKVENSVKSIQNAEYNIPDVVNHSVKINIKPNKRGYKLPEFKTRILKDNISFIGEDK